MHERDIEGQEPIPKKEANPALGHNFEWYCQQNEKEKRIILENELPSTDSYKVDRFKVIEERQEPHESKFEAEFLVDICTDAEKDNFVNAFEKKTGNNFKIVNGERTGKGGWKQKGLKCSRNVRSTLSDKKESGGRGSGSGPVSGVERQPGKNQNCKTTMSVRLNPCLENHTGSDDCFKLSIKLNYDHSHEVESTNNWNFLEVEESVKQKLLEHFDNGLPPSRAKKQLEDDLKLEYGNKWLEVSSKRSINPDKKYVFRLYTSYWHDKFGTINGPEAFQKSKEFIDSYNSKAGAKVASIKQLENGSVVVCVVDEFMKRVHAVTPQSGQIMFVDATGSLDRLNHQLLKLMTESPVGGLPLGFIVLSEQTSKSLDVGFEEIKKLLPEEAFYGRGVEEGPAIIMTDDDSVSNLHFHYLLCNFQFLNLQIQFSLIKIIFFTILHAGLITQ
jgi:hypothetical protein